MSINSRSKRKTTKKIDFFFHKEIKITKKINQSHKISEKIQIYAPNFFQTIQKFQIQIFYNQYLGNTGK